MKKAAFFLLLTLPAIAFAQDQNQPTTLRGALLGQLHSTHDQEEWLVPAKQGREGARLHIGNISQLVPKRQVAGR